MSLNLVTRMKYNRKNFPSTPGKKLIFWMKFNSHGTYINPNSVVAMALMPVAGERETNCRTHKPSTKRIKKLVSKSFTRAAEQAAVFVAGQPAPLSQAVKLPQPRQRQHDHHHQEYTVG